MLHNSQHPENKMNRQAKEINNWSARVILIQYISLGIYTHTEMHSCKFPWCPADKGLRWGGHVGQPYISAQDQEWDQFEIIAYTKTTRIPLSDKTKIISR